ncbi:hypothetical protein BLOT_007896 [Blomia tropicalis]|nr:hypothetical protein BLOT_007896 [Blomia tropicalis]
MSIEFFSNWNLHWLNMSFFAFDDHLTCDTITITVLHHHHHHHHHHLLTLPQKTLTVYGSMIAYLSFVELLVEYILTNCDVEDTEAMNYTTGHIIMVALSLGHYFSCCDQNVGIELTSPPFKW